MCTSTSTPSSAGLRRRIAVVTAAFCLLMFLILLLHTGKFTINGFQMKWRISSAINDVFPVSHRKLLEPRSVAKPDRYWGDTDKCTASDLSVAQIPGAPLPSGIPTFTVEIVNVCASGCDIAHIHLHCGWFSSAFPVDPIIFRRVRYNDCVVNGGRILGNGDSFSFQYANTNSYPLSISSMSCL